MSIRLLVVLIAFAGTAFADEDKTISVPLTPNYSGHSLAGMTLDGEPVYKVLKTMPVEEGFARALWSGHVIEVPRVIKTDDEHYYIAVRVSSNDQKAEKDEKWNELLKTKKPEEALSAMSGVPLFGWKESHKCFAYDLSDHSVSKLVATGRLARMPHYAGTHNGRYLFCADTRTN